MSGPSNIKIQKTGAEEIGNAQVRMPASDLDRYADLKNEKLKSLGLDKNNVPSQVGMEQPRLLVYV